MAVEPTLEGVLVLGLIVLIRTFLSMALEVELEGRFTFHGVPTGQTIRAKIRPVDDLLCCEVLV